jgi:Ca2+/H+ antiporter, TMEM165/GDT1 family
MEWKLFFMTFGSVFLAELGDKTQLATLMFSTQAKKPVIIFIAAASALVLSTLIAVVAGRFVAEHVPERTLKIVAGVGFVAIGVWLLVGLFKNGGA